MGLPSKAHWRSWLASCACVNMDLHGMVGRADVRRNSRSTRWQTSTGTSLCLEQGSSCHSSRNKLPELELGTIMGEEAYLAIIIFTNSS
mmetsp:Transcript_13716/g.49905  ORF Transcript_13716/g.49905 Transcript_13716/m.49905 type:complete len:89 (+) Transcript_13716:1812-2078(+)